MVLLVAVQDAEDCAAPGAPASSAMALAGAVMAANSVAAAATPAIHDFAFIVLLLMEYMDESMLVIRNGSRMNVF